MSQTFDYDDNIIISDDDPYQSQSSTVWYFELSMHKKKLIAAMQDHAQTNTWPAMIK